MSSIGFGLIKAIVEGGLSLSQLRESGIDDTFFQGDEKRAYDFVRDYFLNIGGYPQLQTIAVELGERSIFNSLPLEPPLFWISKVKERKRFNLANTGITAVRGLLESGDVERAVEEYGRVYSRLRSSYREMQASDLKDVERDVLAKHEAVQQLSVLPGIPFGFPFIDITSGGAQSGDSIVVAGQSGVGKTYLALQMALNAYYAGYSVLFLCTEMPKLQVGRRLLAMEGKFDSIDLKLGRLSYWGVRRAQRVIDSPLLVDGEEVDCFFKILPGGLYSRLEDIQVITKELRPHLLCIDGAPLVRMTSFKGNRWERMIEVMEAVKHMAMIEDIATISTYHFSKQAPGTMEGVYGGVAPGQFSSIFFSFEFERKEDRENPNPVQHRILKLLKGRDGESGSVRVLYDMVRSTIVQDRVLSGYSSISDNREPDVHQDNNPYEEI